MSAAGAGPEAGGPAGGAIEPVLLAWSGGKDSSLALLDLRRSQRWKVAGLITTVTGGHDRISMHGVRVSLLRQQAAAVALPLTIVTVPPDSSNAEYEERMCEALLAATAGGIRRVAFGDIFLEDVRSYRVEMLRRLGMTALFPLWGSPTAALARRFLRLGFRATVTCVDTMLIDGSFAGRTYDQAFLEELPPDADPCGENGEFHTFVHGGPVLEADLAVTTGAKVLKEGRFMYCDLL